MSTAGGSPFAGGLVGCWCHSGPGGQVAWGREAGHVCSGLGHDDVGHHGPHPGNSQAQLGSGPIGGDAFGDGRSDLLQLAVEVVDVGQDLAGHEGVMLVEAALEGLLELWLLVAQFAHRHLGHDFGIALAGQLPSQGVSSRMADAIFGGRESATCVVSGRG